jgi:hypothetical protein
MYIKVFILTIYCSQGGFIVLVGFSEQTAIISLKSINVLVSVNGDTESVFFM